MADKATISSLGSMVGKHPAWVRHHVKALEAAGLVALVEERTTANYTEKFYRACAPAFTISMLLRPEARGERPLVALASSDFALELLADQVAAETHMVSAVAGSLDCLIGLRQGLADIAGCHLLDTETGQYNVPYARHMFPDRDVVVVTLAHREQGLIVAPGNPLRLGSMTDVAETGARFVNRNRGSGTRLWLERQLSHEGLDPLLIEGFELEVRTHSEAAARVRSGSADVAVGVRAAAKQAELGFVPLFSERYDLVMPTEIYQTEEVERVVGRLHGRPFQSAVAKLAGYDVHATGEEYRVAV